MSNWRDQILIEFTPKVSKLTLVADPDGLLLEEVILECIRERGFELITFDDHIAFRYAYESKYRSRWDSGEETDLVVLLRSNENDLNTLPYDLLQAGRILSFNLGDIFPNLSNPVVSVLDRGDLDPLYEAQIHHAPGHLGDNATKEFILRHVFEIAPELIKQPSDLLKMLISRHYKNLQIPYILDERLIQLLNQSNTFNTWPLEELITDRDSFFLFLQERWPIFLDRVATKDSLKTTKYENHFEISITGPIDIPFDHDDIRVYIDNLFLEGLLQSVSHDKAEILSKTWIGIGVKSDPQTDISRKIDKLIENLNTSLPKEDARHGDWFHFARGWAELSFHINENSIIISEQILNHIKSLQKQIDSSFTSWLLKRYAGLVNLPPSPPAMLHHLPRYLSRQIEEGKYKKVALIVIDGLAMDQWFVIRKALNNDDSYFRFKEQALFTWVPSLTSVSRQTIFSGKIPLFFPNSIHSTDKEPTLWSQFWIDNGFNFNEILYMKGMGDGKLDNVSELISNPKIRIAGLVVDKIDKIMHGMQMGSAGMHNQIHQWTQHEYLFKLLELLFDQNFTVYLTSDHGNIEADGCGRPSEGSTADIRGERVRTYSDKLLRKNVSDIFPSSIEWETIGLPEDYLALLAPARKAFIKESNRTVCHGGISIEEIIVPMIRIDKAE